MKKYYILLFSIFIANISFVYGQSNFRIGYKTADPIKQNMDGNIALEKKDSVHQVFLNQAIKEKSLLKQLYGYFYLFNDYMRASDYAKASEFLLEAEHLANQTENTAWQGQVAYRQGILFLRTAKKAKARESYEKAIELCTVVGDSLCVGMNWEQIGVMESTRGDAETGLQYYKKGMRLIEEYGSEAELLGTYINYGIVLSRLKRTKEAISYYEKALAVSKKSHNFIAEGKTLNNIADAYRSLGQFDRAIALFKACILFNNKHGLAENRVMNYMGLYRSYVAKDDYQSANEYLIEHIDLRDSLYGRKIQREIAELKALHEVAKKEIALQKSETELIAARQAIERGLAFLLFLLLLVGIGIWRWRLQTRQAALDLFENQTNLTQLTQLLLEKNTLLSTQEEHIIALEEQTQFQSAETLNIKKNEFQENLYNQRILTAEDWAAFKIYFEKTYPNYLFRLRNTHPTLSEAEERLFLFIKLNLTRKEIAAILGISADSVKKTRSRLRKRLKLEKEIVLDDYVRHF